MGNFLQKLDWTRCIDESDIEMANATTCHGMGRMFLIGGVIRRSIWVIICSVVFAVCIWQVSERVRNFLLFELKTDVALVYTTKMDFPAVTICNYNSFSAKSLTDFDRALFNNISYELAREIRTITSNNKQSQMVRDLLAEILAKYDIKEQQILEIFGITDFQTDSWIDEKSWKLTDDILVCSFGGEKCSAADFAEVYTRAGRCYTFRGLQNYSSQTVPGNDGGLSLYINVQQDDYTPYTLLGDYQSEAGVKVIVQPQFEPPDANIGVSAMPGYAAFVPLRLTTMETIDQPPWMECASGTSGMSQPYDSYSVKGCQRMCEARVNLEQCGCKPWFLRDYLNDNHVCGIARTTYCQSWEIDEAERANCVAQCKPACLTQEYHFQATYAQLPSTASVDKLMFNLFGTNSSSRANITIEELRRNWVHVAVYFDEFSHVTRTSSEAYPVGSFLADMGGQFNLFCGFSVLTFCEFLEYFFIKFYRRTRNCYRRRRAGAAGENDDDDQDEGNSHTHVSKALVNAGKTLVIKRLATVASKNVENRRSSYGVPSATLPDLVNRTMSTATVISTQPKPLFGKNKRLGRDISQSIQAASLNQRRPPLKRLAAVEEETATNQRRQSIMPGISSYIAPTVEENESFE